MRALSVARRRTLGPTLDRVLSVPTAFSSSACSKLPRNLPPDYPRRCAQSAVDDAPALLTSAKIDPEDTHDTADIEKPRKRVGRPPGSPNKPSPPPAPTARAAVGPEVIWSGRTLDEARTLPPDDMLQDALAQLLVTLQPRTQYRAAYTSGGSALVEPTVALYCPIEGGDYVIDDTIKELANRIQADVIVIDAAQLAAGEHGSFGKAASVLHFPHNPLHFSSSTTSASRSTSEDPDMDEDDMDEDDDDNVQRVMFGNTPAYAVPVRTIRLRSASNPFAPVAPSSASSSTRNVPSAESELKSFFESIINAPVPATSSTSTPNRPRIIYIRDFSLLAPSAQSWYPALLSAIRSRRQGPVLRLSRPIPNPTTLVLGVSPSLASSSPSSPASPSQLSPAAAGLMNMLMNQRNNIRVSRPDSSPSSLADDRTTRLRDRLRRWSRSGSILDNLPAFFAPGSSIAPPRNGFMTANGFSSIFGANPSSAGDAAEGARTRGESVGTGNKSGYFRACGVVPAVRDEARERASRKARRAEVNSLVVRMAVGGVGGRVVGPSTAVVAVGSKGTRTVKKDSEEKEREQSDKQKESAPALEIDPTERMADDWSRRILDWPSARRLADRALACAVLASPNDAETGPSVTEAIDAPSPSPVVEEPNSSSSATGGGLPVPTVIPWDAVRTAWDALRLVLGYGQESAVKIEKTDDANVTAESASSPTSAAAPPPISPSPKWSGIGSPKEPVPWIDAALHQESATFGAGKIPIVGVQNQADELVERVKNDPELGTHEERLLGCIVNPAELQTTFAHVHLPDSTIDSVRTLVSLPLLYPDAFRSGILAQHAMTGALLFGPPGTGKTLVAKALAKESGARMMLVKPSDVMDMYVGEGEKLVRSVFSLARRLSPCIVFLDEIDALLGARSSRDTGGAASAHRGLVTEFMQEMDGLRSSSGSSNVVVVGATNRPFDLDDAVLRRLPRRLLIDLPGLDEREAILEIMLRDESRNGDVDVKGLARRTEGFSGSDLKNLVVAAALDAVKEGVELPWRTASGKGAKATVAGVPSEVAASVAPDATSSETPVSGTSATASTPSTDSAAASDTAESTTTSKTTPSPTLPEPLSFSRTLFERHFARALKEITPSASEALGTLADLRKWNAEFGGGDRKKTSKAWGGRFGFGGSGKKEGGEGSGRVAGVSVDEGA